MPVAQVRHMNASPEFPDAAEEGPIVTKQIPNGPTVIGFSLPQLLSKVNNLIPQLAQGGAPKIMEISINRNPFSRQDEMDLPELPRMMESLFGRKQVEDLEPLMNEVEDIFGDEEEMEDEIEHFMDDNFYGPEEEEVEPLSGLFSQFGRMVNSLPKFDGLRDMMPWSGGVGGGKLTVIKAGPGFHEEKNYDIGADGHITEVKPVSMINDALEHQNPMDSHFDSEDVEVFTVPHEDITKTESAAEVVENVDAAPVMDVRGFNPGEYMVAVINVDMPPTYGEVTPGSPAPSYKSDMASQLVPGSPAPSYRSVDTEATKVALEPVHGKKEESNA